MADVELILLQRVEKLGQMGEMVKVKPGFARNYLLPQKKALRANKDNLARFEQERAQLEAQNLKRREEAERVAERVAGLSVVIIRQAGESGSLYGSVSARDIAEATTAAGLTINRAAGDAGASDQDAGPGTRACGAASGSVDPGHRQRRAQPGRSRTAGTRRARRRRGRGGRGRPGRRRPVRPRRRTGAATGLIPRNLAGSTLSCVGDSRVAHSKLKPCRFPRHGRLAKPVPAIMHGTLPLRMPEQRPAMTSHWLFACQCGRPPKAGDQGHDRKLFAVHPMAVECWPRSVFTPRPADRRPPHEQRPRLDDRICPRRGQRRRPRLGVGTAQRQRPRPRSAVPPAARLGRAGARRCARPPARR